MPAMSRLPTIADTGRPSLTVRLLSEPWSEQTIYLNSNDDTVVWHMGTRLEHMTVGSRAVARAHWQQVHSISHGGASCAQAAAPAARARTGQLTKVDGLDDDEPFYARRGR